MRGYNPSISVYQNTGATRHNNIGRSNGVNPAPIFIGINFSEKPGEDWIPGEARNGKLQGTYVVMDSFLPLRPSRIFSGVAGISVMRTPTAS